MPSTLGKIRAKNDNAIARQTHNLHLILDDALAFCIIPTILEMHSLFWVEIFFSQGKISDFFGEL